MRSDPDAQIGSRILRAVFRPLRRPDGATLYILQRGVQWKQGVVIRMLLYTILLCNTTQIHCTPLRLHPPVMNTHTPNLPTNLISLLRFVDSDFPGNSLRALEIPPLDMEILLESETSEVQNLSTEIARNR